MSIFSPTRLSIARRRRGITQKSLAERCGVSPQLMSFFEKGERTPQKEEVLKLSFALGFPPGFFYADDVCLLNLEVPSFRSRRAMTRKLRDSALALGEIACEILSPDLNKKFAFPETDMPDLQGYDPEDAADLLRVEWRLGLGPISNMVYLLESKGGEVYWLNEESPLVDAFSFWRDRKPFVILNSSKNSGESSRFDAAHELAHIVLHRDRQNLDGQDIEDEANRFASALLMPRVQVEVEWPKSPELDLLFRLKPRWKVSVAAMIYRGREAGVFSEWQARVAFKKLSATGMRTKEKQPVEVETSFIHNMVFDSFSEGNITPEQYAKQLLISTSNLTELMPTAKGYLQKYPENRVIEKGHMRLVG